MSEEDISWYDEWQAQKREYESWDYQFLWNTNNIAELDNHELSLRIKRAIFEGEDSSEIASMKLLYDLNNDVIADMKAVLSKKKPPRRPKMP